MSVSLTSIEGEPYINDKKMLYQEGSTQLPSSGAWAYRNKLINGGFDIWQRDISQTVSGIYSDDRWFNSTGGADTKTHTREMFTLGQNDVLGNPKYYSKTAIVTSSGIADYVLKEQKIESVLTFAGNTCTLSFWAKADSTKDISIEFTQNFGSGGSPSARVTGIGIEKFTLSTIWTKYTKTFIVPSISGKILGTEGNDALVLVLWLSAGSNYDTRNDSLGNQSGDFYISQVQLEEGSIATPFEQRPIGYELSLCQRYYQTSTFSRRMVTSYTGDYWLFSLAFLTEMRVIPNTVNFNVTAIKNYILSTIESNHSNTKEFAHTFRTTVVPASEGHSSYIEGSYTADAEL